VIAVAIYPGRTFSEWRWSGEGVDTEERRRRLAVAGVGLMAGVGLLGLLRWTMPGRQMLRLAERFTDMIRFGESPTNIEFSWTFFEEYFRRIGPAYYVLEGASAWATGLRATATLALFAAFAWGVTLAGRRRPVYAALMLAPFVLSFGLIFNLRAERHFNLRYFSYLVPLYWLGIAITCDHLARRLGPKAGGRLAYGLPVLIVLAFCAPQYRHLATVDGRNWDIIMPALAGQGAAGGPIVYTNWAEREMLDYYIERYSLGELERRPLKYTRDRGGLAESELKDIAYQTPRLWFISSWLEIQSREAIGWAERSMERIAHGASVFTNRYDVTLYRWDWGGRYVLPPRILDCEPEVGDFGPEGFSQSFLFESAMLYEIRLRPADGVDAAAWTIRVGGVAAEAENLRGTPGGARWISARVEIDEGVQSIEIDGASEGEIESIRIVPRFADAVLRLAGTEIADFYPSNWVWSPEIEGVAWLCLKRNTFADYRFGVAETGDYEITIHGLHDRPGPVYLEVRVDDEPLGVIQFERNTNERGARRLPAMLTEGNRTLTLRFLNEGYVDVELPDLDRDAWIEAIEIRPVEEGAEAQDDRIYAPSGERSVALADRSTGALEKGWAHAADEGAEWSVETDPGLGLPVYEATLPRENRGVLLSSPAQPVEPKGLVYASALLRTEGLENHSINLRAYFFDADGQKIGEKAVNQEGITRTTKWVRFVEFQPVTDEVASFRIALWAYPNGRQPSPEPGRLFFGDLRVAGVMRD
jgi:hypothetical protein